MKLFLLTFLCLCGITMAKAQDSLSLNQPYRMSVIMKVQSVSTIIPLTSQRQNAFAAFFKKEEETLANAINTDLPVQQTEQLRKQLVAEFQSMLTSSELDLYSQKRKGSPYVKVVIPSAAQ